MNKTSMEQKSSPAEESVRITTPSFFNEGEEYYRPEWMKRKPITINEILQLSKDSANLAIEESIRERRRIGLL